MDKYTYLMLDGLFFLPWIVIWFIFFRRIIFARLKFILVSGLVGGVLFFVIDLPATSWGAWSMNYSKTIGLVFGSSVVEELIWTIMVFVTVAVMVEIMFSRKNK